MREMIEELLAPAVVTLCASLIATRTAMWLARRWSFLDRPGGELHKQQSAAVPYGGGLAMAVAVALGLAMVALLPALTAIPLEGGSPKHGSMVPVYLGALALLVVGLYDDLRPLRPGIKLLFQAAIAAVVVPTAGLGIDSLRSWPPLYYGAAWAWLVLVSNAYNLLDHADGMCGSVATVSALVLFSGGIMSGDLDFARWCLMLAAAFIGFLAWNLPPARIYMGDAGSLPLGFLIGAGTLSVTFWPSGFSGSPLAVLSPVLITALPLFDTLTVVIKRLASRRPIMQGDRNHISHRLRRLGLTPRRSLLTAIVLQAALAAGALQLRTESLLTGAVVIAQSLAIFVVVVFLETARDDHG
jgi:UDP-GlcNAc:undecaprenyl-phosphate/decaprenyl-phosphate GlcNAc-1-phosphate transferase